MHLVGQWLTDAVGADREMGPRLKPGTKGADMKFRILMSALICAAIPMAPALAQDAGKRDRQRPPKPPIDIALDGDGELGPDEYRPPRHPDQGSAERRD